MQRREGKVISEQTCIDIRIQLNTSTNFANIVISVTLITAAAIRS